MQQCSQRHFLSVILVLLVLPCILGLDPDTYLEMDQMLEAHGYICEKHTVTTDDGYILTLFRVPGKKGETPKPKQPIYMQPGIFCASDVFVAAGPKKGTAYVFSDAGYDVWVANSRGTRYSLGHVKYKRNDPKYWNFTFEEQGVHDQRAIIEYIVSVTGYQKVHFWSHSMGGTQMFAALTLEPEYYKKRLLSAILTGPVIRFDFTPSPFIKVVNYTKLPHLSLSMGAYEFLPFNSILSEGLIILKTLMPPMVHLFTKFISDESASTLDIDKLEVFAAHFPAGSSAKCFKHLIQLSEVPGFYRYRETNSDPLVPYDMNNIPDIPLAIFTGNLDMLSTPAETKWVQEELLKAGKRVYCKDYPNGGHIPFLIPIDGNTDFITDGLDFFAAAEVEDAEKSNS